MQLPIYLEYTTIENPESQIYDFDLADGSPYDLVGYTASGAYYPLTFEGVEVSFSVSVISPTDGRCSFFFPSSMFVRPGRYGVVIKATNGSRSIASRDFVVVVSKARATA